MVLIKSLSLSDACGTFLGISGDSQSLLGLSISPQMVFSDTILQVIDVSIILVFMLQ